MANKEHLEILLRGVEEWNDWCKNHLGIRANLEGAKLQGANLQSAKLYGANIKGADLQSAKLQSAKLHGAKLQGAKLQGAKLQEASLHDANLQSAKLHGADLQGAKLQNACLQDADLRGAKLQGANLYGAKLRDANLKDASLQGARLHGAKLQGANLQSAKLYGANIKGADLEDANLQEAFLLDTTLATIDLTQCRGLQEVIHVGPSAIATSTLERTAAGLEQDPSQRGAVETFLRGAGVPEDLLTAWFAFRIANPIEFYSCFISYSHADKSFARRIFADLQARGIRCWLDEHQLLPGDDIYDAVDRGIRCSQAPLMGSWLEDEIGKALEKEKLLQKERCVRGIRLGDKVLLCCSEASLTSRWVKEQRLRKAVIPLNLDGYLFDGWQDGRGTAIRKRLAADFTGWESDNAKFEEQFERVVKALRTGDGGRDAPPKSRL